MGFEFWWEKIFSCPDMSRPALSPTHHPVHWVLELKQLEHDVDWSRPSSDKVETEWSYTFPPPICLRDIYGTALPLSHTVCVWEVWCSKYFDHFLGYVVS